MFLLRPVMAEPALCSIVDVRTTLTIDDIADLHEILDVKEAVAAKAQEQRDRGR